MAAPPPKRPRNVPQPEDLRVGTAVVYGGGREGVISDAFAPLNQFWVRDRATGEVVREDGATLTFGAEQLRLAAAPGLAQGQARAGARVLLLGTEVHMLKIIEYFGQPDLSERREPQMLLAVPCSSCC